MKDENVAYNLLSYLKEAGYVISSFRSGSRMSRVKKEGFFFPFFCFFFGVWGGAYIGDL